MDFIFRLAWLAILIAASPIAAAEFNLAPDCSDVQPSIESLWPPNHSMVPIEITGVTDPNGDTVDHTIACISQDEPLNDTGDGNTEVDASGLGTSTASVRRERAGNGNGRFYHIDFIATDSHGARCGGEVTVRVNKSKPKPAVDDGRLYQSVPTENICAQHHINNPPVIHTQPELSAKAGHSYHYQVQAHDPDQDTLDYGLIDAPTGMTIDVSSGAIMWIPEPEQVDDHEVTIVVIDGRNGSSVQSFTVTVVQPNRPPVITTDPVVNVNEHSQYLYNVQAFDPDESDSLTFSLKIAPQHMTIDPTSGSIQWSPLVADVGEHNIAVVVVDSQGLAVTQSFSLRVVNVNDAPIIISTPIVLASENVAYQYQINAIDDESQILTYSVQAGPSGMSVNDQGLLTWLPDYSSAGIHDVRILIQDQESASTIHDYVITVTDVNRPPTIDKILDATIPEEATLTIRLNAGDSDGDELAFSVQGLPTFGTLSDNNIILAPGDNSEGVYGPITVQVSDGVASTETSFNLIVESDNRAPIITSVPVDFVVQGDIWNYTLKANDPDGDSLTYSMVVGPIGASIDPQSGVAAWSSVDAETGNYSFQYSVQDSRGNLVQQHVTIAVLPKERSVTHEGTEFWIPVSINAVTTSSGGTFEIQLVSGMDAEATIEIPALGVFENLSLAANQISTYSISLDEYALTQGFTLNKLIEGHSIHITASSPIAAYFMNQKTSTTDGFLGLPVESLGKEYIAATYIMLGRRGILKTVDGGQLGPIITIVATEDNTQVTIDPVMDIFPGGQQQIQAGTPIILSMDRGDIYNLETKGSFKADLTGSMIKANKPIGVIGQMECVYIPVNQAACDHIVEQLPPIESLATEYYSVPFWGRADNGRWYQEYGDTFRVVAPYDGTDVFLNGVLRARLNRGEYFEFFGSGPQHLESSHPVLMMQYSNGNQFDEDYRELEPDYTDPFMLVVPPAAQFLERYTISTPARDMAYNFVNLVVPTRTLPTLTVDGDAVDENLFEKIPDSLFSYAQLPINTGSHHLEAEEPFGVYVYGYDHFESYGYLGGMAFSVGESVASLTLSGKNTQTLDDQWCAELVVIDAEEHPVNGARIKLNVAGVANRDVYMFTNAHGMARYCYRGNKPGVDTITAWVNGLSKSMDVNWYGGIQNLPPIINSLPDLKALEGSSYAYDVLAEDPNGDSLSYSLLEAPAGMSIDKFGHISWPQVTLILNKYNREKVVVQVSDPEGHETTQSFELVKYIPFNTPPEFEDASISLTGIVGVPYVYNTDHLQLLQDYLKYQVLVNDVDEDAVYVDILSGPDEAYIQRIIAYYTRITRENDPRSCEGCIHYLRWVPQEVGEHAFELGLRDARGGTTESRNFTVSVAPNLPPVIVDFNPPVVASVGHRYSYVLDVENDLLPHKFDNLDNLRVVFEQAPFSMRAELVIARESQKLRIYWTPTEHDVGRHAIRLRVDDQRNASATKEFMIDVVTDNQPPTITDGAMPYAEGSIPYSYQIQAFDPDGDALTYSLAVAPEGMTINEETGVISWIPSADYNNEQDWVRYVVTDARGLSSEKASSIYVSKFQNRAPEFIPVYRPKFAKVGMEFVHQLQAVDREGDNPVSYRLRSSATGPTIDSQNGTITWTPLTEGSFWLCGQAFDSLGHFASRNSECWTMQVVSAAEPLDGEIKIAGNVVDLGDPVTLSILTKNESTSPQVTITVDGDPVDLDPLLQAVITPERTGRIPVTAIITDGNETITRTSTIIVRDPTDITPPIVEVKAPANNAIITAPTDIFGTVQDEGLASVLLAYKAADEPITEIVDLSDFTIFYQGSEVFDDEPIARLDTTRLMNGAYHILLQATDANNNTSAKVISVTVTGNLKVGNFSFTVEDLSIPVSGFPVTVSRTYDSRRKGKALDFGYGWSVDHQNIRVQENVEPTQGWYLDTSTTQVYQGSTGLFTARGLCAYPLYDKRVTITLPNGDTEIFTAAIKPTLDTPASLNDRDCYLAGDRHYDLYFRPGKGTHSTLESGDGQSLYLSDPDNGNLSYMDDPTPVNIRNYTLTTRSGYIYRLNQDFGLKQIEDPDGNTLTYGEDSIVHSSGEIILLNRDAQGRINEVVDPAGNSLVYTYNTAGDLTAVTDREDLQTTYTYNNSHGLLDITDPLGRKLVKNIYDDSGRLIAQEDSDGNRTDFSHDIEGRQSIVTDRLGNVTIFYYDDRGNVITQVDALGHTTQFTYDENDNQLTKTDAMGHTSSSTYNDKEDQLTQTDRLGHTTAFEYNDRGQEILITDAKGNQYANTYDTRGGLLSIEDPQGNSASNVLNGLGLVTQATDLLGHITTYTYDAEGNKLTETDAGGNTTTFTYDGNNNVLTETRTRTLADGSSVSETIRYEYDANDHLIATIDPLGHRTETEYDAAGQEMAHIDALGRRTEMDYDAYGRLIETRHPDGTRSSKTYDAEGNLLSETDPGDRITTYEYDALNRQTAVIHPDSSHTETEYDALGRVTAHIDANGNRTTYAYDAAGRRTLTRDALGNEHHFEYDANGNLAAEVDANGHRTEYLYNALDQRIQTTYHNSSSTQSTLDAMGRRTSQTDQANVTTHFTYDGLGRLISVTDGKGNTTHYGYDEAGNKLSQTDAEGRITTWTYDALGRALERTLPLGQVESFTYDAVGNRVSHTDFNGRTTSYQYDQTNRVILTTYADGATEAFVYGNNGNRTEAVQTDLLGNTHITTYTYDSHSRLISEIQANGATLSYGYDLAGNRTSVTTIRPDGSSHTTSYAYDNLNRLQSVTDASGITSYGYDAVGNRTSVSYPNGTSEVYTYDTLNRLTRKETYNASGTLAQRYDYTLHPTGRRTQIVELNGRTTGYTYDTLYRLTTETITDPTHGDYSASYQYDKVGNRIYETVDAVQTQYTYDDNDRLTQVGGTIYSYDSNGNTISTMSDGQATLYSYNTKNQLINVTLPDLSYSDYSYNIDGIRISKGENGTITDYIVDSNRDYAQVLEETINGTTTATYFYGDDLISQNREGNTFFYHYDGLGSARALSDATGSLTDSWDYEAFGETLNRTGDTENSYLFAGEQFDSALDQYYLRARWYRPSTGTMTQMDTWMGRKHDPITLHKYLYANADPVNYIDPTGNFGLGSFSIGSAVRGILSTTARVGRSAFSFLRAGRVNGVRVEASLQARIQLQRLVGQVKSRIPRNFGRGEVSNNSKGWKWVSKKHQVRVQKGNPRAKYESQRVDYVQLRVNGKVIGRNGKSLPNKKMPEAHIPLSEWKTWARWDSLF